jgi:ABC-2 type transport system ATP-binding protein
MSKEVAIEVKNLSKHFRLPTEASNSVKQSFVNWTKGVKGYKEQKVLEGISFNVEKGDFFGIVGRNGSGKSTLLKLISHIYQPDSGSIRVNGSLVSFIELGVGFNGELTGRENVYLNGALSGFSVKEIDRMYNDIVEFAELQKFMDQKLKNYSSGMQVRLAFACAIRAKSDILVLDEVLAVGDEAFQRKCNDYFDRIRKDKDQTVILVTHSMEAVKQYCNKAVMIESGKILISGDPMDVASQYTLSNFQTGQEEDQKPDEMELRIKPLTKQLIDAGEDIVVEITYRLKKKDLDSNVFPSIAVLVNSAPVKYDTVRDDTKFSTKVGLNKVRYSFSTNELNDGVNIEITAALWSKQSLRHNDINLAYTNSDDSAHFKINSKAWVNGDILRKQGKWLYDE